MNMLNVHNTDQNSQHAMADILTSNTIYKLQTIIITRSSSQIFTSYTIKKKRDVNDKDRQLLLTIKLFTV
jgi:hypothetical protein